MKKILISACLVGDNTKYDGTNNKSPLISSLLEKFELVPFCCEVEGGLKIPRVPAEIQKDGKIINKKQVDVTKNYMNGVEKAINICSYLGIEVAILKEKSPSCGVHKIYDGEFSGKLIDGQGVLASALRKKGIKVINEDEIEQFLNEIN
ncbi:MAG: DUF523 domain-containing protein [Bacilli bacterium]